MIVPTAATPNLRGFGVSGSVLKSISSQESIRAVLRSLKKPACYNFVTLKPAGIYIHIPFCRSRCSYCDFATGLHESALTERYVAGVVSEIASWREVDQPESVDTIYFGGGTPSLLSPAQLKALMN